MSAREVLHLAVLNAQLLTLLKQVTAGLARVTPHLQNEEVRAAAHSMTNTAYQIIAIVEEE